MILHEEKIADEKSLMFKSIEISTKVSEIYLLVTAAAFKPSQVSNLVLSCINNLSFAKTVYNTVQQRGRGWDNQYDDLLNDLDWNDFLISLAMMCFIGMSQK